MGQGGISRTAISDRFHIWGRLRGRKRNLQVCMARSEVLTSVRPLMRPIICRGPVWEFADWIQITGTRSDEQGPPQRSLPHLRGRAKLLLAASRVLQGR